MLNQGQSGLEEGIKHQCKKNKDLNMTPETVDSNHSESETVQALQNIIMPKYDPSLDYDAEFFNMLIQN